MTFNIIAYQHFYLKHPNFQETWKSQSFKIFTLKKSAITFAQGCTRWPSQLKSYYLFVRWKLKTKQTETLVWQYTPTGTTNTYFTWYIKPWRISMFARICMNIFILVNPVNNKVHFWHKCSNSAFTKQLHCLGICEIMLWAEQNF